VSRILLIIFLFFESTTLLVAHTIRPAYLELNAIGETTYSVKWKVPIEEKIKLTIKPHFPEDCQMDKSSFYRVKDKDIILSYWTLSCKKTLLGEKITINDIEKNQAEVLFYFKQDEIIYFKKINPQHKVASITNLPNKMTVAKEYIYLGITHILLGYDHLLFILGLLFIVRGFKRLIQTITSFTLAHSITLGLSIFGYAVVETKFIEILIALSIIILAVEIIYADKNRYGLLSAYPWVIAFFFGLIHGFGFSFALMELGLPQAELTLSLLFFNVGIEVGQLLFISVMFLIYFLLKKFLSEDKLLKGKTFLVYLIGTMAAYWFIERLVT
jgi:hydrogenase/urease accessory protein HupE